MPQKIVCHLLKLCRLAQWDDTAYAFDTGYTRTEMLLAALQKTLRTCSEIVRCSCCTFTAPEVDKCSYKASTLCFAEVDDLLCLIGLVDMNF